MAKMHLTNHIQFKTEIQSMGHLDLATISLIAKKSAARKLRVLLLLHFRLWQAKAWNKNL